MANAAAILNKINKAILRAVPITVLIYKRITTSTGDSLTGRVTSTVVDTILNPQPIAIETGRQKLSGQRDSPKEIITPSGSRITADDYVLNLSASSISVDELKDKKLVFVMKDNAAATTLYIMDYTTIEYQGTILAFKVYVRNVQTVASND